MTILAVFKSRAQTLDFLNTLKGVGVAAQAVSTPKEAGVGCGISAKFDEVFLGRAKRVLLAKPYSSYAGFLIYDRGRWRYAHM